MAKASLMVVGAGQMGIGIAQAAAASGMEVAMHDKDAGIAQKGLEKIERSLSRDAEKGRRSSEEADFIIRRISIAASLEEAADADFVIEAVNESLPLKAEIFRLLDIICSPSALFASNTSSLSITQLGSTTNRPSKVIGMHFMNPVPVMPLVEMIRGQATSDETFDAACELIRKMDKSPVEAADYPGFVSNRVLMPMINEAVYCVYEHIAEPEAVDQIMKMGMNHPMGPLALADFIGLDTCLSIMEIMQKGFGDPKYRPCPLLRNYVHAGWLGRKTGRGFYNYE